MFDERRYGMNREGDADSKDLAVSDEEDKEPGLTDGEDEPLILGMEPSINQNSSEVLKVDQAENSETKRPPFFSLEKKKDKYSEEDKELNVFRREPFYDAADELSEDIREIYQFPESQRLERIQAARKKFEQLLLSIFDVLERYPENPDIYEARTNYSSHSFHHSVKLADICYQDIAHLFDEVESANKYTKMDVLNQKALAQEILGDHQKLYQKILANYPKVLDPQSIGDPKYLNTFGAARAVFEHSWGSLSQEALSILEQNIKRIVSEYEDIDHAKNIKFLVENSNSATYENIWNEIEQIKDNKLRCFEHLLNFNLKDIKNGFARKQHHDFRLAGSKVIQEFANSIVPDEKLSKTFTDEWVKGAIISRDVHEHLETMLNLESGACSRLFREYGIVNFGRYPIEMLNDQYHRSQNLESTASENRPFGLIIYPRDDWNGAFMDARTLRPMYQQIKKFETPNNYVIDIYECQSKNAFKRTLIKSKREHPGHKISFAIIGGHGTPDSIQFGSNPLEEKGRTHLHAEDLRPAHTRGVGNFFKSDATLILESCSTGTEGGVGAQLNELFGFKIKAPKKPASTAHIEPFITGSGQIDFSVDYSTEDGDAMDIGATFEHKSPRS